MAVRALSQANFLLGVLAQWGDRAPPTELAE
jgi:hypothetical protein